MIHWCALKVRMDCPECGSPVIVDGPYKKVACTACQSKIQLTDAWRPVVAAAFSDGARGTKFQLSVVSSMQTGTLYLALNKDTPPHCSSCDQPMDGAAQIDNGTTGDFHCTGCGAAHPTWPAPGYLKKAGIAQVFVAPPPNAGPAKPDATAKPVVFECMNCGGKLSITGESQRITTCTYCDVDTYLPPEIWHRMHPVRRRRAFWLRRA